jgi:hypothetical protein
MGINNLLLKQVSKIFFIAALLAGITAVYHLYYAFTTTGNIMIRHIVFIFINLFLVFFFVNRPSYFIILFFLLSLQQLYSHGSRFVKYLSEKNIDWISAAVIIIMPFLLYLLILEKRTKK